MASSLITALRVKALQTWLHEGHTETLQSLMQQPEGVLSVLLRTLEKRIRKDGYTLKWKGDNFIIRTKQETYKQLWNRNCEEPYA